MTDKPTKHGRGRPKTFDRDHTLDVAIDSYWREGVGAVSVNEICRRASISKPGLYREFGGEDNFLDAALTRYLDTVLGPMMSLFSEDRPFRQTLDSVLELATSAQTSGVPSGCLFAKMRTIRGQLGPTTGEHVDRVREQLINVYTRWLEACVQRGDITLPASLASMASYVDTQMTLVQNRMAAGEDPTTVREHAYLAFAILTLPPAATTVNVGTPEPPLASRKRPN